MAIADDGVDVLVDMGDGVEDGGSLADMWGIEHGAPDDGDDQESPGESEEDDGVEATGEDQEDQEAPSDEEGDPEDDDDDDGGPAPKDSASKLFLKLRARDKDLINERSQRAQAQREAKEAREELAQVRQATAVPDDPVEAVRAYASRVLGIDVTAPEFKDQFLGLLTDATIEYLGPDADSYKDFKERREERQRSLAAIRARREMEERIERLEREKTEAVTTATRQQQHAALVTETKAVLADPGSPRPFLMDIPESEGDPVQLVIDEAAAAIRGGHWRLRKGHEDADGRALIGHVADILDAHYRGLAEKLSAHLASNGTKAKPNKQQGAQKTDRTKQTGRGTTGGGGKGRADTRSVSESEEESFAAFMSKPLVRSERGTNRRSSR